LILGSSLPIRVRDRRSLVTEVVRYKIDILCTIFPVTDRVHHTTALKRYWLHAVMLLLV